MGVSPFMDTDYYSIGYLTGYLSFYGDRGDTEIALGEQRIGELQESQEEAIIVDEVNDLAIVIGFKNHVLHIITVLDDHNIWNNRGTKMVRLNKEEK